MSRDRPREAAGAGEVVVEGVSVIEGLVELEAKVTTDNKGTGAAPSALQRCPGWRPTGPVSSTGGTTVVTRGSRRHRRAGADGRRATPIWTQMADPAWAPMRTASPASRLSAWPSRRSAQPPMPSRCSGGPLSAHCLSLPPGCPAPTRRRWCATWPVGSGYPTRCAERTSSLTPARRRLPRQATAPTDIRAERGRFGRSHPALAMHEHTAWPTCLAERDRDCDRSGELSITARRAA
jgi:hypothetical protein